MKKKGRGKSYENALIKNLVRNLNLHNKIRTTVPKAKLLKVALLKKQEGMVRMVTAGTRRGDNALQIDVEWLPRSDENENKPNKTKRDTKNVASN